MAYSAQEEEQWRNAVRLKLMQTFALSDPLGMMLLSEQLGKQTAERDPMSSNIPRMWKELKETLELDDGEFRQVATKWINYAKQGL